MYMSVFVLEIFLIGVFPNNNEGGQRSKVQ